MTALAIETRAPRRLSLSLLDRYLISLTPKPFGAALAVMMVALLLERLLRILNTLAENGGSLALLGPMIIDLVPHYLGLALPASFFIAIFMVIARLGDDSEIDALLGSGVSIARLVLPFVAMGVMLSAICLLIFGYLQPHGRYAFQVTGDAAAGGGWDATVQPGALVSPGKGFVLTADKVDITGRGLKGVFLRRQTSDGEQVITAANGRLIPSPDGRQLRLIVQSGMEFRERVGERTRIVRFDNIALDEPFDITLPPFRPRGATERELTFPELAAGAVNGRAAALPARTMTAELGGRLVRCLSVPFLPLLAFPLGMAAKRRGRGAGLVIAAVLLLGFHHAVQFGESLGDAGRANAAAAVWIPFAVFITLCSWLFSQSLQRPGQNPLTFAFDAIGEAVDKTVEMVRRRLPWFGDGG